MLEEITHHKIILAGLDSTGKTSIYRKMIEGAFGEDLKNSPPTSGIQIRNQIIDGHHLLFWELGGQAVYRSQYFKDKHTFVDTSILIYVLDVQDKKRFGQSQKYFLEIMMTIKILPIPPRVFILIHKLDPTRINDLRENFLECSSIFREAKKFPSINVSRFHTSIYSDTLEFAFKKILQQVIPHYSSPYSLFEPEEELIEINKDNGINDKNTNSKHILTPEVDTLTQKQKRISQQKLISELTRQFDQAFDKIELKLELKRQFAKLSKTD